MKTYRVRLFDTYHGRYVFKDVRANSPIELRDEVAALYPPETFRLEDHYEIQR